MRDLMQQRLTAALAFSLVLHACALFGIGFVLPDPRNTSDLMQPLQVVLVNSKSRTRPTHADALAQHNLNGGGNTPDEHQAKTPLPALRDDKQFSPEMNPQQTMPDEANIVTPEEAAQHVKLLEQEAKRLLAQIQSTHTVASENIAQPAQENERSRSGADLVQSSLAMARLEAQISKDTDTYQKRPRLTTLYGARTQEYRFAQYVEDWRIKVERIGNLNYPDAARQRKIYGSLQLTVAIRADGSLESVEINRPSGHALLDAAAQRIVKLAAPFSPLPPDIRRDTDILSITRTWTFTPADELQSE